MSDITTEVIKEVVKDVYADAGKPIAKPTGELIGILPRAIKAALLPIEKWVISREYNLAAIQKILETKLKNIPPDQIESPEPYIAIPALQYISYCMDNEGLRNMYANLLANSMNKVVKNGVHPSFVEIIKQMCPDEAKLLSFIMHDDVFPVISLRNESKDGGFYVLRKFTNFTEFAKCEHPYEVEKYVNNLERLGLIETINNYVLHGISDYYEMENHPFIKEKMELSNELKEKGYTCKIEYGTYFVTQFGKAFSSICINHKQ